MSQLISDKIARWAAADPAAVALSVRGEPTTYGQLDGRVRACMGMLRRAGVTPGRHVAVALERSVALVATMLASFRLGAVYTPLDLRQPAVRIERALRETRPAALVIDEPLEAAVPAETARLRSSDLDAATPFPGDLPEVDACAVAYAIHTSGSTGAPKCVAVTHRSLASYAGAVGARIGVVRGDRYLHTASFVFSASMRQLLVPLVHGATVLIAAEDDVLDPPRLWERAEQDGATLLDVIPSYLDRLLAAGERSPYRPPLRLALTTGEPLRAVTARRARAVLGPGLAMINLYGQTETAGSVTAQDVPLEPDEALLPVGRPLSGATIRILGRDLDVVPRGATGEVCVLGAPADGCYLYQPGLTALRFVPDPAGGGARLYRTGDIGRWRADGTLELFGRADHMVKVRGVRVGLSEVEMALAEHPAVTQAVVNAFAQDGVTRLVAYLQGEEADAHELRAFLAARLPPAAIPGIYRWVESFPTTSSGKVDRGRLPPPLGQGAGDRAPAVETGSALERLIHERWCAVLGTSAAEPTDDFFAAGGDSLMAVDLVARIQEVLPAEAGIPLTILFFQNPSIRGLAEAIRDELAPEDLSGLETRLGGGG